MKPNKHGLAILESLIAVVILSVGLTVVIQALLANHRALHRAVKIQEAAGVLDNVLFDLLRQRFVEPGIVVESEPDGAPDMSVVMTNEPFSGEDDLRQRVTVQIAWPEGADRMQQQAVTLGLRRPVETAADGVVR